MAPLSTISLLALATGVGARDVVSFDFGWSFRTGLHSWADPNARPVENPDPGANPAEAVPSYNASDWRAVQLPHDGLIATAASTEGCPGGCSGKSYIARHVLWYRKAFALPASWAGSLIYLDFEGSFRETTVYVNGVRVAYHDCGYTPFRVRLDNLTALRLGADAEKEPNVIAVFIDPDNGDEGARDHGSGWWYEGGGLYRPVSLVRTSPVHVEQDGLFAYSNLSWATQPAAAPVNATVHASAAVSNGGASSVSVCVVATLTAPNGSVAAPAIASTVLTLAAGESHTFSLALAVAAPQLWTAASPTLYTISASVRLPSDADGTCAAAPAVDELTTTHGFRSLRYDADHGFS